MILNYVNFTGGKQLRKRLMLPELFLFLSVLAVPQPSAFS